MPFWTAREYSADEPAIPPHPVYPSDTRYPVRSPSTAMRSPTPQGSHPLLRRSPSLNVSQYSSFSLMQQSHADRASQNQERPQQPLTSYERPPSHQTPRNERPASTTIRPPTPQGPHPLLRRSPSLNVSQYSSFSLMQRSHVDGASQNQERQQQPLTSYKRPPSHQNSHSERPASRQGKLERRTHELDRPETRQNTRPESRQRRYSQPESRQHPNLRPESRQQQHLGPETPHAPKSRPSSRQEQYSRQEAGQGTAPPRPPSRSTRPPSRPSSRLDATDPVPQQSDRKNSSHNDAEGREFRKAIADTTIAAINKGIDGVDVRNTQRYTKLYQDDHRDLANWKRPTRSSFGPLTAIEINITLLSTLNGARFLADGMKKRGKIGVLNFASAILPGGAFLAGARAQEESIARSSTLYVALTTPAARPFYATHTADDRRGFYTHNVIYSPDVHLFRDDDGAWLPPLAVDVVTSPAVNAGQVRRQGRSTPAKLEERIQDAMHERMGRILALFERKKVRNLVLGSFGTGVFQNDIRAMAAIWYELLQAPGARFAGSFDRVVFAIPDESTARKFGEGFRGKTSRNEPHSTANSAADSTAASAINRGLNGMDVHNTQQHTKLSQEEATDPAADGQKLGFTPVPDGVDTENTFGPQVGPTRLNTQLVPDTVPDMLRQRILTQPLF